MLEIDKIRRQRHITKVLEDSLSQNGFLPGHVVADVLGIEHSAFHDTLYNHFCNQVNAPQIYEYDAQLGKYVPAVDPYLDPIRGMQLYGTATYEIRKCDVPLLKKIFSNKEDVIETIDAILN